MDNAISWFEIPATDIDRAQKFYETIFQIQMQPMDFQQTKMRMFPLHKPSATDGPLLYLNGNPDVQITLDRVEAAGGKIVVPKTEISPEYGYMAVFIDTEGNRIALHSVPEKYLQK